MVTAAGHPSIGFGHEFHEPACRRFTVCIGRNCPGRTGGKSDRLAVQTAETIESHGGVRRYVVQYVDVPLLHGHCSQHVGRELVARTEEVSGIAVGLHPAKAALQIVNIEGEFERFHTFGSSNCAVRASSDSRSTPFTRAHRGRNSGNFESYPMTAKSPPSWRYMASAALV